MNGSGALKWMANNRVAANVLMVVLAVGGLVTLAAHVRQEVFPEVDLDEVQIRVAYPGASPAEVEQGVVLAIEEAVRGLDGVKQVRSSATEGAAVSPTDSQIHVSAHRPASPSRSIATMKVAVTT